MWINKFMAANKSNIKVMISQDMDLNVHHAEEKNYAYGWKKYI
jgi:hypothetical protein